jgi:hypothetical protein
MNKKKFRGWCANGCGSELKQGTKYCCRKCHARHHYELRIDLLKRGDYPPSTTTDGQRFVRKFLCEYYGDRCTRCGWAEVHPVTGQKPLEVEHIDGNWRNTRLENLTLLCPNCHSLTATFRALNRGRGREKRRGGRENPFSEPDQRAIPPRMHMLRVETQPDSQLVLISVADVAERLKAPDL